jgi:broad specificity phosphatase PhoE
MSVLTLVRHAQASFFQDDYDRLSPLGEQQARLLGEFWSRQGWRFDEVYTGPRLRQRQTAELAGAAYRQTGLNWPEPVVLEDGDEYDLSGMIRLAPELALASPEFAILANAYQQSDGERERLRSFQTMFETLLHHWQAGRHGCPPGAAAQASLESWPVFRERVARALRLLRARPGRGRRVALFTSGGFIGTAVQGVVAAPQRAALELNWRVRNCSLTEFVFTRDRVSLDSFNGVPHLADPSLWTFR